jgi:uncharacterized protein YndB with AHSA1/START domain
MRLRATVRTPAPLPRVFTYLSDFTTTTRWDPNTVSTVRTSGDGGVGTSYLNTSVFRGRQTQLRYVVEELVPNERVTLRGENRTVVAVDTISCRTVGPDTEVTYTAQFRLRGMLALLAPLLRPAFAQLAERARTGLAEALTDL